MARDLLYVIARYFGRDDLVSLRCHRMARRALARVAGGVR